MKMNETRADSICCRLSLPLLSIRRAAGLYIALGAIHGALFAAYFALEGFFRPGTVVGILIVFVLEEAYIIAKLWSRLLFFASQLHMFRDLTASVLSVDVEESVQPEARA